MDTATRDAIRRRVEGIDTKGDSLATLLKEMVRDMLDALDEVERELHNLRVGLRL